MRKIDVLSDNRGLTLVELVIGIALAVILLSALFTMLSSGFKQSQYNETHIETERTVRYAIDKVVQELRFADTIEVTSDANTNCVKFRDIKSNQYYIYTYNKTNHILYRQSATYSSGNYIAVGTQQPITGINVSDSTGTKKSSNILISPDTGSDIFVMLGDVDGRSTATLLVDMVATDSGLYGTQGYSFKTKTVVANIGNIMP